MRRPNDDDGPSEYATDLLIQLAARVAWEQFDPEAPENARFIDWLAREARRQLTTSQRRLLEQRSEAFAERVLARVQANRARARHRVRCVNEPPRAYPADASAPAPSFDPRASAPRWDLTVAAGVGRELWDEPPSGFVALPDGVGDGRYIALGVAGDSMTPLLHTGDTILVKLGADLVANQIVVARHPECGYVVKRVGRVTSRRVELTSLNPAYAPLELPNDVALVLGSVVLRWCPHESSGGHG